jgi:hypothetical protein
MKKQYYQNATLQTSIDVFHRAGRSELQGKVINELVLLMIKHDSMQTPGELPSDRSVSTKQVHISILLVVIVCLMQRKC